MKKKDKAHMKNQDKAHRSQILKLKSMALHMELTDADEDLQHIKRAVHETTGRVLKWPIPTTPMRSRRNEASDGKKMPFPNKDPWFVSGSSGTAVAVHPRS